MQIHIDGYEDGQVLLILSRTLAELAAVNRTVPGLDVDRPSIEMVTKALASAAPGTPEAQVHAANTHATQEIDKMLASIPPVSIGPSSAPSDLPVVVIQNPSEAPDPRAAFAASAPAAPPAPLAQDLVAASVAAAHAQTVDVTATPPPPPRDPSELDKEGIPWDARIHGENRAKNADGRWRRRRNCPDSTFDAVMAELKALMLGVAAPAAEPDAPPALDPSVAFAAAEAAEATVPPPPAPPAPPAAAPVAPTVPAAPVAPPAPPAAAPVVATPPAPPAAPPAAPSGAPTTFMQLMPLITAALGTKKCLSHADLLASLAKFGVPSLGGLQPAITARPELIGELWTELQIRSNGLI